MKLYKDKDLKEELDSIEELGIGVAGETKRYTFYIHNDTKATVDNLRFDIYHKEVKVIEAPKVLKPNETAPLTIEWKPSVTVKQGLKAELKIHGFEVYEPGDWY